MESVDEEVSRKLGEGGEGGLRLQGRLAMRAEGEAAAYEEEGRRCEHWGGVGQGHKVLHL